VGFGGVIYNLLGDVEGDGEDDAESGRDVAGGDGEDDTESGRDVVRGDGEGVVESGRDVVGSDVDAGDTPEGDGEGEK
jgi:hypothetical protein